MQTATVLVSVAMQIEIDTDRPIVKLDPAVLENIRTEVAREIQKAADEEAFEEFGLGHYFVNVSVPSASLQTDTTPPVNDSDNLTPEQALEVAAEAQTRFWNALTVLEQLTGVDVESTQDLAGLSVEDLLQDEIEDAEKEEDDEDDILCECGRSERACATFYGAAKHRDRS